MAVHEGTAASHGYVANRHAGRGDAAAGCGVLLGNMVVEREIAYMAVMACGSMNVQRVGRMAVGPFELNDCALMGHLAVRLS